MAHGIENLVRPAAASVVSGDELVAFETEDALAVVSRWSRPSWATRSVLDDMRVDHERHSETVTVAGGDHRLNVVLWQSDTILGDGDRVAIVRDSAPVIDLRDSAVTADAGLVGAMTLAEARQLAHAILELVRLGEAGTVAAAAPVSTPAAVSVEELVLVEDQFAGRSQLMTVAELEHPETLGVLAVDEPAVPAVESLAADQPPVDENTAEAARQAAGLRALADMIQAHPELVDGFRFTFGAGLNFHPRAEDRPGGMRLALAAFVRAAQAHGARITTKIDDTWHNMLATFTPGFVVEALAYRSEVCEGGVTGTRTVTAPDTLAAAPMVAAAEAAEPAREEGRSVLARAAMAGDG
jgi:hypothetical protein